MLILAALLAYGPVWHAGFVWDDKSILTANPCVVGPLGLRQIWTTHYADICPLTLSLLWLEHALWGLSPAPYHLVNVLLHAAATLLLWRVLRTLGVAGAWFGAAIWCLHPVEVASVAWVAELKNTLSGVFFLSSVFWFLRWLQTDDCAAESGAAHGGGSWLPYGLSVAYGGCALASKSSTVTLPVVLGLCVWWMRGSVRWQHVIRLVPLFVLAAAAAAVTLWTQRLSLAQMNWASASAADRVRPWSGRLVGAGDAIWFYLGKLLWPHPLVAIYPRWQVDAGRWTEWFPVLGVVAVLLLLWWFRRSPWARSGFFAFAYFLAALLPVSGLLDGTDFRYSLAFDHFQYLASMGPLAFAGAGIVRLGQVTLPGRAEWQCVLAAGVLLALGTLSWRRCEVYRDEQTFWMDTVAGNPGSWLARGNLGSALLLKGQVEEARAQYEQALAVNPNYAVARDNLGVLLLREGKIEQARQQIARAVAIDPSYAEAHSNLGNALLASGQVAAAIQEYEEALAINPELNLVRFNLGNAWFAKGDLDEAITQYKGALAHDPGYVDAYSNLGNAYLAKRQLAAAIAQYQKALSIDANHVDAHNNLGVAFLRTGRFDEAIVEFQAAMRLAPKYPNLKSNLSTAQMLSRRARRSP